MWQSVCTAAAGQECRNAWRVFWHRRDDGGGSDGGNDDDSGAGGHAYKVIVH